METVSGCTGLKTASAWASGIEAGHLEPHFATIPYPNQTLNNIEMMHFSRSVCLFALALPLASAAADHDCLIEAKQHVDLHSPVEAVVESM
jgi:hypothetical protein